MSHQVLASVPPKGTLRSDPSLKAFAVWSPVPSLRSLSRPPRVCNWGGGCSQRGGSCFGKGGVQGGTSRLRRVSAGSAFVLVRGRDARSWSQRGRPVPRQRDTWMMLRRPPRGQRSARRRDVAPPARLVSRSVLAGCRHACSLERAPCSLQLPAWVSGEPWPQRGGGSRSRSGRP